MYLTHTTPRDVRLLVVEAIKEYVMLVSFNKKPEDAVWLVAEEVENKLIANENVKKGDQNG